MASYMDYEFQQLVYTFNEKAEGISSWKEYLEGLTKQQTSDIETATQQASYDISGAYANYKKAQLNLLQNRQLGAGFKEQLDSDLKSSYASAYGKVQQQLASNVSNIASQYDKLRSDAQKSIQESASYLDSINRYLYDYMGKDIGLKDKGRESGGLGYYETDTEGNTTLTPYGKAELSYALLNSNKGQYFTDYVAEVDKKTYDWLMNNLDLTYGSIAGLEPGTRSFDAKERDAMIAAENAERKYSALVGGDYDKTKKFNTEQERLDYYNSLVASKYNYRDYDSMQTSGFRWNEGDEYRKTVNSDIQNDIRNLLPGSKISAKTEKTTWSYGAYNKGSKDGIKTTITIDKKSLTNKQISALDSITKSKNDVYTIELHAVDLENKTNYNQFFDKLINALQKGD